MGTVVAIAGQHIAYATAPLSLAIVLNLTNRQRLVWQHQQEHLLLKAYITHCYDDLSGQFPSQLSSSDIHFAEIHTDLNPDVNLSEIQEQINYIQDALNILENKSASLATKVYQNLSVEIDVIRQEITNISEPFDITNLENEIESLYAQIATFANENVIDSNHYDKFHYEFKRLERKHEEVIVPCIKLLLKDVRELKEAHLRTSMKLDTLTQQFISRPELAQVSKVKRVVSQLRESVSQIQQTEIISELLNSISQLKLELEVLSNKFNYRPETQQLHQLEFLVTMLVTSVTHLKRLTKDEEGMKALNKLQLSRKSKLKKG